MVVHIFLQLALLAKEDEIEADFEKQVGHCIHALHLKVFVYMIV